MLTIEIQNTIVIFKLSGAIDNSTSNLLECSIRSHMDDFYTFIIDFTKCDYLNSYTVNLLFQILRSGKDLYIIVAEDETIVKKIFQVLNADKVINIYNSYDEVYAAIKAKEKKQESGI